MNTDRMTKGLLIGGFAALIVAVLGARNDPATAYEVSIYWGTPIVYWAGVATALVCAVGAGLATGERYLRGVAAILGGVAGLSLAALPLLRGYYYYGEPDGMTHLGWARELTNRVRPPTDLIYPGIHLDSVAVRAMLGVDVPTALLLVTTIFALAFITFTTLTVSRLVSTDSSLLVGAASAYLFLPINNIGIQLTPHPISQSVLLFAFVLFLTLEYVVSTDNWWADRWTVSSYGVLLALTSLSLVLYHPQMATVMLIFFGTISAVQWYARQRRWRPLAGHRPLYWQTAFLTFALLVWTGLHEVLVEQAFYIGQTFLQSLVGQGEAGSVVQQKGGSLNEVGAGYVEIFLKLFLVPTVYVLLTGLFLYSRLVDQIQPLRFETDWVATYVLVGSLGIGLFSITQFVGNVSRLFFRYLGIGMVIATIFGAVALATRLTDLRRSPVRIAGSTVLVMVLLALSVVTLYPSPYVYQASTHQTESTMEGYRTAFAHDQSDVPYSGIGYKTWRFHDAVARTGPAAAEKTRDRTELNNVLDPAVIRKNLTTHFERGQYVAVSKADRKRELRALRGIRYGESDFARLGATTGVDRVQSSGNFTLYLVPGNRSVSATPNQAALSSQT